MGCNDEYDDGRMALSTGSAKSESGEGGQLGFEFLIRNQIRFVPRARHRDKLQAADDFGRNNILQR
jgi:hypothetical protein